MRTQTFKLIGISFLCGSALCNAADLKEFESTCADIGFKRKTEAFGDCVLELVDRASSKKSPQSQDNQLCKSYGFKANTPSFADCKLKLDLAKKQSQEAQQKYDQDKAEYDRRMAELKKQQDQQRAMKQLELGLRMMGGQSPADAVNSVGTGRPIAPSMPSPINQTITTPSGRIINCTTIGNNTNCF